MNPSMLRLALLCLFLGVDSLFCALVAGVTGLLARHSGASPAAAILRAGAAFVGAATLSMAVSAFLASGL
ncbi:hypothetical protein ABT010_33755 [Streptomyces sp. NPDC002668]|uniref:hypothetical protein n=1 Tax=Streptomyces sp. NPDC002668 TaxID=3154422 RepID=UPI0033307CF5